MCDYLNNDTEDIYIRCMLAGIKISSHTCDLIQNFLWEWDNEIKWNFS